LWSPANGRLSTELEVLSGPGLRRRRLMDAQRLVRKLKLIERWHRVYCEARKLLVAKFPHMSTVPPPGGHRPRISEVCAAVSRHYGIPLTEMLSMRRTAPVVKARQVAMYIAAVHTLRSLPEIGRRMAGKDHTTVLHAKRKIARLIADDLELASDVRVICAALKIVEV